MCVPGSPSGLPDLNWSLCGWPEMAVSFTALLCTSDWSSTISNNIWHMSACSPEDVLSTCVSFSIMFDNILNWLTSFSIFCLPSHKYVSLSSETWIATCKHAFFFKVRGLVRFRRLPTTQHQPIQIWSHKEFQ